MTPVKLFLWSVLASGLSAAAALAQAPSETPQAPATAVSPLTVQGTTRETLQKQTRAFVETYATPTGKLGLLAKWSDPACVAVTGLVPEQGARFRTRIDEVAKAVGAPVASPKCVPNVEVVFTKDPQKYLTAAAAKNPAILGEKGVKTVTRPIQAWYASETKGVDPRALGRLDDPVPPAKGESGIVEMARIVHKQLDEGKRRCVDPGVAAHNPRLETPEFDPVPKQVGTARLVGDIPCPHSLFRNVLIVVDAAHMGDVPVDLTADYLALVALSEPRSLDGCLALPSVLDLYAVNCPGRETPVGLTPADRAYLAGLYASEVAYVQFGQGAKSEIAGRMVRTLTPAKAPGR